MKNNEVIFQNDPTSKQALLNILSELGDSFSNVHQCQILAIALLVVLGRLNEDEMASGSKTLFALSNMFSKLNLPKVN